VCRDKKIKYQEARVSVRTCVYCRRCIQELGTNLSKQLQLQAESCDYFALTIGESDDITDTEQLMTFICVIDTVFHTRGEAASVCCLRGITTGKGLILKEKIKLFGKIDMTTNSGKNKKKV